jgi:hypothetical protein
MEDEVAAVVVPKFARVENGYEKVPVFWSVAQLKVPLAQVRYCPAVQPPRPVT